MPASKMEPYPEYRSISHAGIIKIPNHWNSKRMRFVFRNRGEVSSDGSEELLSVSKYYGVKIRSTKTDREARADSLVGYKKCEPGDVVSNIMRAWNSDLGVSFHFGIVSPAYEVYVPQEQIDPDFLDLLLRTPEYAVEFKRNSRGIGDSRLRLYTDSFNDIQMILPPLSEQKQIGTYVHRIDENISLNIKNLEIQLSLLEEKRSALITQAVTKGLNLNVPMKDSGIEWIGQIPQHWKTKKVKYLFHLVNEPSIASHGKELLSVYTAIGVRPRKSLEQKGNKATSTDGYWLVQKEDLVVNKLLAWMGAIGRSEYDGVTSPAYDILRPLKDTVTEYFHFLFRCGICQPEFKKRSRGIMEMRLRLYFEELGSIEVPCPPPNEQQEIADYIRNLDDTQIDLETGLNKQIEMLTEFRTALISAAVTGKIDVRGQA